MNNDKKILAKPSGITLEEHINNVVSEAVYISDSLLIECAKYENIVGKSLAKRLVIVCKRHDDGKQSCKQWQEACQKDYEAYLVWNELNNGSFQDYSKKCKDEAGKHIRLAARRHEFHSIKQFDTNKTPPYLFAAIAAHHGKLSVRDEQRWISEGFKEFWTYFNRLDCKIKEELTFQDVLTAQYEFAGPRGLLQFADRRASAKEDGQFVPNINKFQYKFPHSEKRGVQKLIEENWDNDLLLVRAPTGAGKTDASLLWASLQIEHKKAERLIIAMPTRFTSNALEINVAESLSDTGLYHSSAWMNKFQSKVKDGVLGFNEAKKNHDFARLLYTPITVCTIDHLLTSLTLMREDHHQITFNLANSCLVIDEADFYDEFVQANILTLLTALKEWNVPILLMSASLPQSILPIYNKIGYNVKEILEDNSDNERIRFAVKSIREYDELSEIKDLLEQCLEIGTAIIYANTVDKAMSFYDYFVDRGVKAIVYHSRFTEPHKKEKEEELISCLGKKAWEEGCAKGIAILTQIGEMSINISADFMISEICPIDRLTQRAGRLSRFAINGKQSVGVLHVIIPQKNNELYPAPYGSYDLKEKSWKSIKPLLDTINKIGIKEYNSNMLVSILNEVYSNVQEFSGIARANANTLEQLFISNWLINPQYNAAEDDMDMNYWRSRNIPPQDSVYVSLPESLFFCNYFEFQEWKLSNSIEIPIYLIKKFLKNHILDYKSIYIKNEEQKVMVIREGFYSLEKGVFLPNNEMFF